MNIDTTLFRVVEKDGLRLILPCHTTAVSNKGWTQDNLWYRSRVETPQGRTVSQGFGKFFNLGMGPELFNVTAGDILGTLRECREEVVATLKYDGSCLIRSVYQKKVMFRTRGSLSYEFHDNAQNEMGIFLDKYPKINDPSVLGERISLLFEWVSPNAQIVIKYKEPELHLIGAVIENRAGNVLRYATMKELEGYAKEIGVPLVEYFMIQSTTDWHHFYREVVDHREIEGYVLRLDGEQTLVKIKATAYLTKHGIKSNLSFKNMIEFWLQHGQDGIYHSFLEQLENMYDEEIVMWALPYIDNLFIAVDAWTKARTQVEREVNKRLHWVRKEFAIEMQEKYKKDRTLFSLAMTLWLDGEVTDRLIRNFMVKFDKDIALEK